MHARPQPVTLATILLALLSLPNVLYPLLALKGELAPLIYLTVVFGVAASSPPQGCGCSSGGHCGSPS